MRCHEAVPPGHNRACCLRIHGSSTRDGVHDSCSSSSGSSSRTTITTTSRSSSSSSSTTTTTTTRSSCRQMHGRSTHLGRLSMASEGMEPLREPSSVLASSSESDEEAEDELWACSMSSSCARVCKGDAGR